MLAIAFHPEPHRAVSLALCAKHLGAVPYKISLFQSLKACMQGSSEITDSDLRSMSEPSHAGAPAAAPSAAESEGIAASGQRVRNAAVGGTNPAMSNSGSLSAADMSHTDESLHACESSDPDDALSPDALPSSASLTRLAVGAASAEGPIVEKRACSSEL